MDDELLARVRALLDREALAACVHAYARGLDRVDEELILSAFHPDEPVIAFAINGKARSFRSVQSLKASEYTVEVEAPRAAEAIRILAAGR